MSLKAKFHIPGIWTHYNLNTHYIDLLQSEPELFRDEVEVASVYGTIPPALWNGGRSIRGIVSPDTCKKVIDSYNERKIPVRFTFTNPMLEERHLKDKFCNMLCQMAENDMNEIIIFSPMLEEYIRKTYPKFTYTSSTCKQIEDPDKLVEELNKDYRLVVLDYNWNNQFDFLETLPHKEKCEFLLNAICISHCKLRKYHYQYLGKQQIITNEILPIAGMGAFGIVPQGEKAFQCPYNTSLKNGMNEKTYISCDAVYNKYLPMGFSNFKIEGRTYSDEDMLNEYIKYMVKPECAEEVRSRLIQYTQPNQQVEV